MVGVPPKRVVVEEFECFAFDVVVDPKLALVGHDFLLRGYFRRSQHRVRRAVGFELHEERQYVSWRVLVAAGPIGPGRGVGFRACAAIQPWSRGFKREIGALRSPGLRSRDEALSNGQV